MPTMASPRMINWELMLSSYSLRFRNGADQTHAKSDALNHLPLPHQPDVVLVPCETIQLMEHLSFTPISAVQVKVCRTLYLQELFSCEPMPDVEGTAPFE